MFHVTRTTMLAVGLVTTSFFTTASAQPDIAVLQANFDASAPDGSYTFKLGGPKNSDKQIVGIIRPVK